MAITIKTEREIALMRQAGKIVARVLGQLVEAVRPGLKTEELDLIAEREIRLLGGTPSFKGYHGYPSSLCVSINDEIVHGIPGERVIQAGDIVSLDLGAIYQGYQGDAARTVGVGSVSLKAEALMQAAALTEKQLHNRDQAMSLYQELLDKYPGSIYIPDARKKFRLLRGDATH